MYNNDPYFGGYGNQPNNFNNPPMGNQNMMMTSNCDFIKVEGPEKVREYTVRPSQTIYFLDNNDPIMYVKSANNAGLTDTKAYKMEEIDFNSLINPNVVGNQNGINRDEFDALAGDIRNLVSTINGQNDVIAAMRDEIDNMKSNKYYNKRRNGNEPVNK